MHTSFLRLPAAVLVSNVRGTMESRPCVHGCGRQSFGSHRHCCRYCGTGGHTRGCDRRQWQQQRDHRDSTPEQVPAKWRNWYEGAGHRLKALIVLRPRVHFLCAPAAASLSLRSEFDEYDGR
eukprot:s2251_g1.t1